LADVFLQLSSASRAAPRVALNALVKANLGSASWPAIRTPYELSHCSSCFVRVAFLLSSFVRASRRIVVQFDDVDAPCMKACGVEVEMEPLDARTLHEIAALALSSHDSQGQVVIEADNECTGFSSTSMSDRIVSSHSPLSP